ncbi:MAG: hypothetical protein J6C81_08320 [Muribaculaceae bacterium]|nr:hypothetical protein [Muribaculaceae bacterium]
MAKKKEEITFYYRNEDDRAYGLAGMAVSLAALDALDRVVEFSLDADGPMVSFSNEYYFSGSPSISPKATWDNLIQNFYITSSMVLSNIMARVMVRDREQWPREQIERIHKEMIAEGNESCALEEDEIDAIYERSLMRMRRIFDNPRVHPAVSELARVISRKRRLSGREIIDELHLLQLI